MKAGNQIVGISLGIQSRRKPSPGGIGKIERLRGSHFMLQGTLKGKVKRRLIDSQKPGGGLGKVKETETKWRKMKETGGRSRVRKALREGNLC